MKKFFTLFVFFAVSSLFAQDTVRQITHFNFDVANPVVSQSSGWDSWECPPYLIFEAHNGDSSNIASLSYWGINDDFEELRYYTRDGYINKNPLFFYANYCTAIIWETNRNGNFDIAYVKKDNTSNFDSVYLATNTPEDEKEVKLVKNTADVCDTCIFTIFKRGTRVIIKDILSESAPEDTVFVDENGAVFSQPVATFSYYYSAPLIAVAVKDSAGIKELAYRIKDYNGIWGNVKTVDFNGAPDNPVFENNGDFFCDYTVNGKSSIYHILFEPAEITVDTVITDSTASCSKLQTVFLLIPTHKDDWLFFPYNFEKRTENGTFVNVTGNSWLTEDTTISVSVADPQTSIGVLDYGACFIPVLSVWVDSVDGHKNIFGMMSYVVQGGVEDNTHANKFTLYQNYPNPFSKGESGNSVTTIKYTIPSVLSDNEKTLQATSLKVYDILGREVATLVNKQQPSGTYSVTFDAGNLPSGTYFYRLQIGKTSITKKMILLK